ncbi:MAG: hypothetical protein IIB53_11950 [Planctomycetes bacterium]|nr:hypothetical protein [Planctomycetota bacterium]
MGLTELGGDEGDGRVLTIDPPGAAGFTNKRPLFPLRALGTLRVGR